LWSYCLIRLNSGCRGDAAVELGWDRIDFDMDLAYLNPEDRTQTKKYRAVMPLSATMAGYLESTPLEARKPTIVHRNGRPFKKLRETRQKHRDGANLPGRFIPKVLRHTVATELRRRGVTEWEACGIWANQCGYDGTLREV
jgi:integrase